MGFEKSRKILERIIEKYRSEKCIDRLELISYYAERPDGAIISVDDFITSFNDIKILTDNIYSPNP